MRVIPIGNQYAATTQEVVIDNKLLRLDVHWNTRGEFWSLDIYDDQAEPIVLGIKLVLGTGLLDRYTSPKLPRGELMLVDTTDTLAKVGYDDLGTSALLVFMSAEELSAL